MDTKELRRAYATLGLDARASLDEARNAYLAWVSLLTEPTAPPAQAPAVDLAHHELDLAWYAIEKAHRHGAMIGARPRGCQDCGATPAVRVTSWSPAPGWIRARVVGESALHCRECGVRAARTARRAALRSGWWGLLGPAGTVRAWTRNSAEIAFLRRITPATPRQRRTLAPVADVGRHPAGLAGHRVVGWVAGLIAVALAVGTALPSGSASSPARPGGPTVHSATVGRAR